MLKKNKKFYNQFIYQNLFANQSLISLIKKSFRENFEYNPKKRATINPCSYYPFKEAYCTRQKLRCLITQTKSVPTRRLHVSRFYLAKYADSLKMSSISKIR